MDRKIVLLIVAAIVIIASVAYVMTTQNSSAHNSTDNTTNVTITTLHNESSHINNNHTKTNDTTHVKISAAQAQKIAVNAIKEDFNETYIAGTPTLYTIKETPWWHVPLNEANGNYVGSLDVNAITGKTNGQW